jgi:hypothetical protein
MIIEEYKILKDNHLRQFFSSEQSEHWQMLSQRSLIGRHLPFAGHKICFDVHSKKESNPALTLLFHHERQLFSFKVQAEQKATALGPLNR